MPFKKGQSGNLKGRPKNSKNKATEDLRQRITALIEKNFDQLEADISNLDSEKRLIVLERYLKYCLPPLQSLNIQGELRAQLETLTDDQLNELAEKIISLNT